MKLNYYPDTDSLYIDLSARPSADSREVSEGVVLDYDEEGNLVYIDNSFIPLVWSSEGSRTGKVKFKPNFKRGQLFEAINNLLTGEDREKALNYLERLEELTDEALKKRMK